MSASPSIRPGAPLPTPAVGGPASILDGRYTFENFVVGSGNRMAYAAAKSVAESPGENYNPLLIYSPSGLGKTHLLAAIGRQVQLERPDMRVAYASTEALVGELLGALRRGDLERFRAGFAETDVLLVDDLQFLAGHPETQEELLQLLDALIRRGRQVVLVSDRGPDEIAALDERLLARFRGGLIVDIQNPDYETRAAILRFKIREHGEEISPEVVEELAGRAFSNIRELEGALHKLFVLRAVEEGPLTPSRVRELLRRSLPPRVGAEDGGEFEDFLSNVAETLSDVLGSVSTAPAAAAAAPSEAQPPEPLRAPLLEYRFESWIAGPANRLATESARRVIESPGTRFNPLFLHSPTGMGKTHLVNAIGNAFLERAAGTRVAYQSAESFTDELITAIEEGALARWRAKYRSADLLLLDDVHSVAGRERTQEELFHVFNELHGARKQIVIASDRPPRELQDVEQRLVSRFEGGLVVEIAALDEATAAQALAWFLHAEGFDVDERMGLELARHLRPQNMREIQGQAKRASLRADSAGLAKDSAFLRRILLHARPEPRSLAAGKVDPFFTDPYKVFLHWEPLADRLVEHL
ncbi:MAG TPA: DnaA/Hda family protein [Gemmatimonadota bacterium]